jgi:cysteine desulfurase
MHYFDHCATTPLHPEVLKLVNSVEADHFANPSSVHAAGRKARALIEKARRQVGAAIQATPGEIIFTGGGSEANNLVLWNLLRQPRQHVITSAVEHPSVYKTLQQLEPLGVTVTVLPVDSTGMIKITDLESAFQENTGLVTIMFANNEVGTIQPLREIIRSAHARNVPVHSDGVQAAGKIEVNVKALGVDYLSFSGHKIYGPKGVGFLYARKGSKLRPFIIGGGQEHGLRAGTENTPAIAGLGLAMELASRQLKDRQKHLRRMEHQFVEELKKRLPEARFNGHEKDHLPGVLSVTFPSIRNDLLLAQLDRRGIAVSSGSACSSGTVDPSPVLKAMGLPDELNLATIRISFGIHNTEAEIKILVEALAEILQSVPQ